MQVDDLERKLSKNNEHQKEIKQKLGGLSWIRILTFLMGVGIIIISNLYHYNLGYILGFVCLIAFIVFVRKYGKVDALKKYYEAEEKVLEEYKSRMGEEWKQFEESGEAYKGELSRVRDLDLLGRSSLYQYICTAHTPFGKRTLAEELISGHKEKQVILKRQEAIKELIEDEEYAIHLQTLSMQIKLRGNQQSEESFEAFIAEAERQKQYISKGMKVLALGLPFITVFCLVLALLGIDTQRNYIITEVGFGLQLLIAFWQLGKTKELFIPIHSFNKNVDVYKEFLEAIENKQFKSLYLKDLQSTMTSNESVVKGIESLNKLTESIKVQDNFLANIILNGFLMWDVHCKDALAIWNSRYGKDVRKWFEVVGEMESLVSLAVIGRVKETYCFPSIEESQVPQFTFENMRHPLILEDKAIGNSLQVSGNTCIITGSNMSGKTTFLRSIGVNLALAYTGAPVVAEKFTTSYMEVFTSMRIEDRVDEGISTFYAELLRIKEMIEYSQRHLPMLVLIDEIFKGTNSSDRILGATETIKKLGKPWLNVMVTTHDFELCSLAEDKKRKTVNYHFEEYYRDNQIYFDYKIKDDRCKTTNAKYLLKMVGILD